MSRDGPKAVSRRRLLAAGAAAVGGAAGCLSGREDPTCEGRQVTDVGRPARGASDAPLDVVVYGDFACPRCREFFFDVRPAADEYVASGDVRYVRRDYPVPVSDWSWPLANAARAVHHYDGGATFWAYAELLYANQGEFSTERVASLASEIGASGERARAAAVDGRFCEVVTADKVTGERAGVDATPTVFVGDAKLANPAADELTAAIEDALPK